MTNLIDRAALKKDVRDVVFAVADTPLSNDPASKLIFKMGELLAKKIDDAPGVDAEPVRHGRWIVQSELEENPLEYREYDEHFYAVCSECGRIIYLNDYVCITGDYKKAVEEYPFCHCGARMDGDVNAYSNLSE